MKRKYLTEYGIAYMNSFTCMVTAQQIAKGGVINPEAQEIISKCNIYIIASRPSPYFNPELLKHENDTLSGKIYYKVEGKETSIDFDDYPWKLEDDATSIVCKYPYHEIRSLNPHGEERSYLPASYLANAFFSKNGNFGDLERYEVLYIGQSLGNQGNRSVLDRIRKHETLQKILALTNTEHPDKEIMIFMYQFENEQIIASMDGITNAVVNTEENDKRFLNAKRNPPNRKQKIGLIEAGLIRYFQPLYNEKFKIKFPSTKLKVLESCYNLDITGLVIELDSSDLNCQLYSNKVHPNCHHIAQIDLVSSQNRQSFFSVTGILNNPEIIT